MIPDQRPSDVKRLKCLSNGTREFATIAPEAATAGKPIPGKAKSPQHQRSEIGVFPKGKVDSPALQAAP